MLFSMTSALIVIVLGECQVEAVVSLRRTLFSSPMSWFKAEEICSSNGGIFVHVAFRHGFWACVFSSRQFTYKNGYGHCFKHRFLVCKIWRGPPVCSIEVTSTKETPTPGTSTSTKSRSEYAYNKTSSSVASESAQTSHKQSFYQSSGSTEYVSSTVNPSVVITNTLQLHVESNTSSESKRRDEPHVELTDTHQTAITGIAVGVSVLGFIVTACVIVLVYLKKMRSAQDNVYSEPFKKYSEINSRSDTSSMIMTEDNYDRTCVFPKIVSPSSAYDSFSSYLREGKDHVYDRASVSKTNKNEIILDSVYSMSPNRNKQTDPFSTYDTTSAIKGSVYPDDTYNKLSSKV